MLLDIDHLSTLIIPLTINLLKNAEPLHIRVEPRDELEKDLDLLIDQIRALDNKRIMKGLLTILTKKQIQLVYQSVCEVMGIDSTL